MFCQTDFEKVQQRVAQIPWGRNIQIIIKAKAKEEPLFYVVKYLISRPRTKKRYFTQTLHDIGHHPLDALEVEQTTEQQHPHQHKRQIRVGTRRVGA